MKSSRVLIIAAICHATAVAVNECCLNSTEFHMWNTTCAGGEDVNLVCPAGFFLLDQADEPGYFMDKNGTTDLISPLEEDEYCVSSVRGNGTEKSRAMALACIIWEFESFQWAYMIIMIISLPFLIATITVYSGIPDLRDLNGKCIIGYVASLTLSYTTDISRNLLPELAYEYCSLRGATVYFSTISVFAWLNLVTFNVWKSVRNKVYQMSERKMFFLYLTWSIGLPILMCAIVGLVDVIPGSNISGHFSIFDCWFSERYDYWILFYLPLTILIGLNILMFIHCCWILWRGYRDPTHSRTRLLRTKLLLTLRLFFLSGVLWIFEVVSFSLEGILDLKYIWLIFDSINSAQGIIIFILLVACQKRVLRAIYEHRLCGIKWPEAWGDLVPEPVSVLSEIDKVALEHIKEKA